MDLDRLKALIDLVSGTRVAELEIVEDGCRIRIVASASEGGEPEVSVSEADSRPPDPEADAAVRAPLYGILHLVPSPGASAYVAVGDAVEAGQTLCMIESMKVFNPVPAARAGTVAAVLVENGAEVESGQPLFRIE